MARVSPYRFGAFVIVTTILAAATSPAQEDVGTVVSVLGSLQVRAAGSETWERLDIGTSVPGGAAIRSGERSAARIVFHDGSAIEIAASAEISVRQIALVPTDKRYLSLVRLERGKIHVLVGEQYGVEGSRFEVETPTAVATARRGHFIVRYDESRESTTVAGLEGDTGVQGTIGLIGPGVTVGPGMFTQVQRGRFPAPAGALEEDDVRAQREGLTILGTGRPGEGVGHGHPAATGRVLRPEDLPNAVVGEDGMEQLPSVVSPARWPDDGLADRLSPDIRAHTQPIPEYRAAPPGERPSGSVRVEF